MTLAITKQIMPGGLAEGPRKILILDDSNLCRELTKRVLLRAGFEVRTISTHIGFGLVLNKERPDLALVEINLSTLGGVELIDFVARRLDTVCKMVLYSKRPGAELSAMVKRSGAAGYIRKSDDWGSITASVHKFCQVAPRDLSNRGD